MIVQTALADPAPSSALTAALQWLEGTLLGSVTSSIAIIAVAVVGFSMLTGRINWRRGATVILGCFILFGARTIAEGLRSAASLGVTDEPVAQLPTALPPPMPPPAPLPKAPATPYDPYAGASVPTH